jgi:TolA-binding protein
MEPPLGNTRSFEDEFSPSRGPLILAGVIVIAVLLGGTGLYFLKQSHQEKKNAAFQNAYAEAKDTDARMAVAKAHLSLAVAAPELLELGGAYLQAGNLDKAEEAFTLFTTHFPHHPLLAGAQLGQANVLIARKNWQQAAPLLEKIAYSSDPKTEGYRPAALLSLALVLQENKDRDGARQTLQELIAKYPSSAFVSQAQGALDSLPSR